MFTIKGILTLHMNVLLYFKLFTAQAVHLFLWYDPQNNYII
jgi:hypothetical protein